MSENNRMTYIILHIKIVLSILHANPYHKVKTI